MNKIFVHEAYTDKPMFININAIDIVTIEGNKYDEYYKYTKIFVGERVFPVKETFDTVILKIRDAESEDKT